MNNPIRRSVQKRVEFRLFNKFLEKHGIDLTGGVILDVGCGSGYGTELIRSRYNPKELVAFDLMPEQIEIARFYERIPKPTLIAIQEFMDEKTYYRNPQKKENEF